MQNPRKPLRAIVKLYKLLDEKKFIKENGLTVDNSALKDVKPPFILIYNHIGYDDHLVTGMTLWPTLANFMVVRYIQHVFPDGPFSYLAGSVYKSRYTADTMALLGAKRVLREQKAVLAFSPAACYCFDGTPQYFDYAAARLLKTFKVPVFVCKMEGMYFMHNRLRKNRVQGSKVSSKIIKVFDGTELAQMTQEEIFKKLYTAIDFNDFQYQEKTMAHLTVKKGEPPLIDGMDHLLYKCLNCGSEFRLRVKDEKLVCEDCGNTVVLDDTYFFRPESEKDVYVKSVDRWNRIQRLCIDKEIEQDDFALEEGCQIWHYTKNKKFGFSPYGKGVVRLDKDGIRYHGEDNGKTVDYFFALETQPSVAVEITQGVKDKQYFVVDRNDEVYRFELDDMRKAVKFQQALRALHLKYYPSFPDEKAWIDSQPTKNVDITLQGAKPKVNVMES